MKKVFRGIGAVVLGAISLYLLWLAFFHPDPGEVIVEGLKSAERGLHYQAYKDACPEIDYQVAIYRTEGLGPDTLAGFKSAVLESPAFARQEDANRFQSAVEACGYTEDVWPNAEGMITVDETDEREAEDNELPSSTPIPAPNLSPYGKGTLMAKDPQNCELLSAYSNSPEVQKLVAEQWSADPIQGYTHEDVLDFMKGWADKCASAPWAIVPRESSQNMEPTFVDREVYLQELHREASGVYADCPTINRNLEAMGHGISAETATMREMQFHYDGLYNPGPGHSKYAAFKQSQLQGTPWEINPSDIENVISKYEEGLPQLKNLCYGSPKPTSTTLAPAPTETPCLTPHCRQLALEALLQEICPALEQSVIVYRSNMSLPDNFEAWKRQVYSELEPYLVPDVSQGHYASLVEL